MVAQPDQVRSIKNQGIFIKLALVPSVVRKITKYFKFRTNNWVPKFQPKGNIYASIQNTNTYVNK